MQRLFAPSPLIAARRLAKSFDTINSNHTFDLTTSVEQEVKGAVSSYFKGNVTDKFSIGDAPNGGYLMAMAVSAARHCIDFRDPLSITGHYTNKSIENAPCDIEVRVLNVAKTTATVEISLSQQDRLTCKFLGTFGSLDKFKGMTKIDDQCPALPPVEECLNASKMMKRLGTLKIANEFDMLVSKDSAFANSTLLGKVGDQAELIAWIRFTGGREPCLRSLTFFCDALPPPVLNIAGPSEWVPTIEYTAHLWNRPDPKDKWLRARFVTNHVENGKLYTDGEIWSEDGHQLYAKSRQLARLLSRKN